PGAASAGRPPRPAAPPGARPAPRTARGPASAPDLGRLPLLEPVQVLADPSRVVDHLVAVHQHGHPALPRQLVDLVAVAAAEGDPDLLVVEPAAVEAPGDLAARAEPVGGGLAAVED